jgi:hypothetical protein
MNKLIKLSDTHYIVVDDSEKGKEGYNYNSALSKIEKLSRNYETHSSEYNYCRRITHSTQPLEEDVEFIGKTPKIKLGFVNIKPLSLSEVEEVINGHSVEKMAEWEIDRLVRMRVESPQRKKYENIWIQGFKAHQELVKDKLFTVDEVSKIFTVGVQLGINQELFTQQGKPLQDEEKVLQRTIQSLLPKTEWDVEFVDGKIKLI